MNEEFEFLQQSNFIESERSDEAMEDALAAWNHIQQFDILFEQNIRSTHEILLARLRPDIAGKFRWVNVRVGGKICPPFDRVSRLMSTWVMNHSKPKSELAIRKSHVEFEKIHPFEDGNGRIGRIIMNWQRKKAGLPILIIHEGEEQMNY